MKSPASGATLQNQKEYRELMDFAQKDARTNPGFTDPVALIIITKMNQLIESISYLREEVNHLKEEVQTLSINQ